MVNPCFTPSRHPRQHNLRACSNAPFNAYSRCLYGAAIGLRKTAPTFSALPSSMAVGGPRHCGFTRTQPRRRARPIASRRVQLPHRHGSACRAQSHEHPHTRSPPERGGHGLCGIQRLQLTRRSELRARRAQVARKTMPLHRTPTHLQRTPQAERLRSGGPRTQNAVPRRHHSHRHVAAGMAATPRRLGATPAHASDPPIIILRILPIKKQR